MTRSLRGVALTALVFVFASGVIAEEPIPPLPLATKHKAGSPDSELPEVQSPCTFDVDAGWLAPLGTGHNATLRLKVPHPINCEGAVIRAISATGLGSTTRFQFTVAFRPGHDRNGIVSFGILDNDKNPVAVGEASDNLDEGQESYLIGTLKIKNREFDRVFAKGQNPVMRVTLRVGQY